MGIGGYGEHAQSTMQTVWQCLYKTHKYLQWIYTNKNKNLNNSGSWGRMISALKSILGGYKVQDQLELYNKLLSQKNIFLKNDRDNNINIIIPTKKGYEQARFTPGNT